MKLCDLKPTAGSKRPRKRIGRGPSSGHGKTSGKGAKGQSSRSGGKVSVWSEGGQMPLQRRIPKRGFRSRNSRVYQLVNLEDLNRKAENGSSFDPEAFLKLGLARKAKQPIKVLATGEIEKAITVRAHAFSKSAKEKIENAGGRAEIIE